MYEDCLNMEWSLLDPWGKKFRTDRVIKYTTFTWFSLVSRLHARENAYIRSDRATLYEWQNHSNYSIAIHIIKLSL
jgi:hypothetical protein